MNGVWWRIKWLARALTLPLPTPTEILNEDLGEARRERLAMAKHAEYCAAMLQMFDARIRRLEAERESVHDVALQILHRIDKS